MTTNHSTPTGPSPVHPRTGRSIAATRPLSPKQFHLLDDGRRCGRAVGPGAPAHRDPDPLRGLGPLPAVARGDRERVRARSRGDPEQRQVVAGGTPVDLVPEPA